MRKSIITLLVLIILLTACSRNGAKTPIDQLPEDYTLVDAKSDHCVVFEDDDITCGQSAWDKFVLATTKGKPATVRLAYYYTLGKPSQYSKEYYEDIKEDYPVLYIKDLRFDVEKYMIESVEDNKLISKEYKYLVKYEGEPNSTTATFSKYKYYVLVNEQTITWDDIEHGMFSSQFDDWIDHDRVYTDLVFK